MAAISLRRVSKSFAGTPAVNDLTLDAPTGVYGVIVGPSGGGKTTTLRLIAGLEQPNAGEILIDGRDMRHVTPDQRRVAMVFQSDSLYPHLTARQNLAFPLRTRGMTTGEIERRVNRVARELGLLDWFDRKPGELSAGQQQRVALGRALIVEPSVLLLDEPLANLDTAVRTTMRALLKSLQRQLGCTVLHVTHDQDEGMRLADVLFVMHEGAIVQSGPPTEVFRGPADRFVASFIGDPPMNFIDGTIEKRDGRACFVESGADAALSLMVVLDQPEAGSLAAHAGQRIVLGVRPNVLRLADATGVGAPHSGSFHLNVDHVEHVGSYVDIHGRTPANTPITARLNGVSSKLGSTVQLSVDANAVYLFESGPRGKGIWPKIPID